MFLKKLYKLLIKKGKATVAMRNLKRSVTVIRGSGNITVSRLNLTVFRKLAPLVKIYKKKVAGKVYQLPWRTTKSRAAFQAAKWFVLGLQSAKKGKKLSVKIGKLLIKTLRDRGVALKLRLQFVDLIKENRSYMRFIKKKRIKRRRRFKGRFRNKFTKKSLSSYIFFKFYKKYSKRLGKNRIKGFNKPQVINGKKHSKKFITKNKKQRR